MLSRWFARFAAVPALCGALSCSNEMPVDVTPPDSILILVEVVGTLPQMSALQVRASLNSQSDMTGLSITQNTSRFAVKLPNLPENYGALKIDAFSLDSDQCQLASGQVTETLVTGKTYYELKLTLSQQAQRRCQLLVQATGTGNVTSDPTGIDCGGSGSCPACADYQSCSTGTDCTSLVCANAICQPVSCSDGVKNGSEADIDCGGSCVPCTVRTPCGMRGSNAVSRPKRGSIERSTSGSSTERTLVKSLQKSSTGSRKSTVSPPEKTLPFQRVSE